MKSKIEKNTLYNINFNNLHLIYRMEEEVHHGPPPIAQKFVLPQDKALRLEFLLAEKNKANVEVEKARHILGNAHTEHAINDADLTYEGIHKANLSYKVYESARADYFQKKDRLELLTDLLDNLNRITSLEEKLDIANTPMLIFHVKKEIAKINDHVAKLIAKL